MARVKERTNLYKIGEVARMTGIQPFVLRFWEKEFQLKLPKAKSGHRFYRQEDIQKILSIKRLLYTEGYTIKGAYHKIHWGEDLAPVGATKAPIELLASDSLKPTAAAPKISPLESNYRKTLQNIRGDVELLLKEIDQIGLKN